MRAPIIYRVSDTNLNFRLRKSRHRRRPVLKHRQNIKRKLLDRLKADDFLILLDERGRLYSTVELADQITQWELSGRSLVFAIGGADGWCEDMRQRADSQWSLSKLVFPHPLARVVVVEQLYRADSVRQGHPYHRS